MDETAPVSDTPGVKRLLAVAVAAVLCLTACGSDGIGAGSYTVGYDNGTDKRIDGGTYETTAKADEQCSYATGIAVDAAPVNQSFTTDQYKPVSGTVKVDLADLGDVAHTGFVATGPCTWRKVG